MYYRYPTTLIEPDKVNYCIENLFLNNIINRNKTYTLIKELGNFNFNIKIKNTENNISEHISFFTLPSNCSSVYILDSNMSSTYIRYMFHPFYYSNAISFKRITKKFIQVYDNLYVYPFPEDYFVFERSFEPLKNIEYVDYTDNIELFIQTVETENTSYYHQIAYHDNMPYIILFDYNIKNTESLVNILNKFKKPILYICLYNEHYKFKDNRLKVKTVYSFKAIRTDNDLDLLVINTL